MEDVSKEILESIAVLSRKGKWTTELNIVSWGGREPKYDIRSWNEDHTKCSKGIGLVPGEAQALLLALKERLEGET